jgi:hypothetical protein
MTPDHEENFEAWFNKQFGAPAPEAEGNQGADLAYELTSLCERYGMPAESALFFLEKHLQALKEIAVIVSAAQMLEKDGMVREGFAHELWSTIGHSMMQFMQQRPTRED